MDTSQIKRFAVEARNILKQGVINRITALGFNDKGEFEERNKPQRLQGNTLFMGQLYDENFYDKWMALYNRVRTKGIKEVYEEAAYTWFNRLMAIRIMEKNGFSEPVLAFDDDRFRIPRIVSNARAGQFSVNASDREKLSELLMDDTKTTEQFTLLITSFCHTNPVINNCFGGVSGYTEILLPTNILTEGGFVDMLNHTEFITDDDYTKSELIGWLYQFYISEKKDEVFESYKGGHKAEAEDIPAATQIFTPNWIVKYMVQNTIGRIYLDNNPDSDLKENWKYLVEPSEPTPEDCIFKYDDPKELTMADLGCGSGHILNEGFDILYDIYIEEGYSRKQAVENIFKYNLTGVDIDTRAKQLATFALMMKACQKDDTFLDCHIMPNVLDMPDVDRYSFIETDGHFCCAYQIQDVKQQDKIHLELVRAFELLKQAHNLGSIMKFDLSDFTLQYVKRCVEDYEDNPQFQNSFAILIHAYKLILALTKKYASLVANPPYMGSGNMNGELSQYVKDNYPDTKQDLFSVFMEVMLRQTVSSGRTAFITMESWMFLSSFERMRKHILDNYTISSLGHFGWHIIGIAFGTAMTVIHNTKPESIKGEYSYLTIDDIDRDKNVPFVFPKKDNGRYAIVSQKNFEKIPGCPIGYWVSENVIKTFNDRNLISSYSEARSGFSTGNNNAFVRLWFEVSLKKVGFGLADNSDYRSSGYKYVPFTAGGGYRKWYGNLDSIVDWTEPEKMHRPRTTYMNLYYKPGLTWNAISSGNLSCRYYDKGFLFEHAAASLFVNPDYKQEYFLAFLNTNVFQSILKMLNPTLNNGAEVVSSVPILFPSEDSSHLVQSNISISKSDWDAHETSWDFETNELLKIDDDTYRTFIDAYEDEIRERYGRIEGDGYLLEALVECYKEKWEENFHQLHSNEEELNRQFIKIYGLQDELTPDVPLDEITILQQGEISIEENY